MDERPTRKLAVLLHADVVGSTALVRQNETLAHQRIQGTFRRFSKVIESHGGIAHEIRGDALVAEFPMASDAVAASVEFQAANAIHTRGFPDYVRPVLRVGIAMGEVVVADYTVTGEGVVLAQRLEQLADAGGVCIQDAAYQTVPKRLPFEYRCLGELALKGFEEPVRVHAVGKMQPASPSKHGVPARLESLALDLPQEPSIAILPFINMSGDPEQEHFADGITEDIITALSRISGLLVVARNSTMTYKGAAVDIKTVGREQGVRYVLAGSVRKSGSRVRVTAQLTDATTGHHLWADRYDRKLDDVFEVQDDITQKIIVEMRVQIGEGEQIRLWAGGTESVEAWEFVARSSNTVVIVKDDNLEVRRLAQAALDIDPNYVDAIVELGRTHWSDAYWGWNPSRDRSMELALACARRALELNEVHAPGRLLLALCASLQGEHDRAVSLAEEAVALAPSHAKSVYQQGVILRNSGQYQRAVERIRRAMRLSPIFPPGYSGIVGSCHHLSGNNDRATEELRIAVGRIPESVTYKAWLTSALLEAGLEEASMVARNILRVDPEFSSTSWAENFRFFRDQTVVERLLENLIKAGLPN